MPEATNPVLSVAALIAERDTRRRKQREADEQLQQKEREERAEFRKRLETFQLNDERVQAVVERIRRAFEKGETELLLTSFPSEFCSDNGRAVTNADLPPINKPAGAEESEAPPPEWVETMPAGVRVVYDYWKNNLKSGGFKFFARVINYKDGKPGDVGLFLSWSRSPADLM